MILKEYYRFHLEALEKIYPRSQAANILQILYEWALGLNSLQIKTTENFEAAPADLAKVTAAFEKLLQHYPVQYVVEEAWFYKRKFKVSPAVLIPRPETEELVEIIVKELNNQPSLALLDVGTGSGCLAISLAKELNDAKVTALDVSEEALAIARENASKLKAAINFINTDFLAEDRWFNLPAYDVLVSNPPYIPQSEAKILDKEVTAYEPHLALFVTDDSPLLFYKKMIGFAENHLKEAGYIFMELHQDYAIPVKTLFKESGYDAKIINDISGNARMLQATRCR